MLWMMAYRQDMCGQALLPAIWVAAVALRCYIMVNKNVEFSPRGAAIYSVEVPLENCQTRR